jgi:hypothetical protein
LRANPLFDPSFSEIVDLRAVEKLDLGGEDMLRLADTIDPFSPESKRGFVVQNPTQGHAAKIHKILRIAGNRMSVFHSVEEAAAWIGVKNLPRPK